MSLFNLFKPKWKNSDSDVRLEAVSEIENQKILKKIALNDEDQRVRKRAIWEITDQDTLKYIAENDVDLDVQNEAFESLSENSRQIEFIEDQWRNISRKDLKNKNIDINFQNLYGETALIKATYARENSTKIRKLIALGADTNIQTIYGGTALMAAACKSDGIENIKALLTGEPKLDLKNHMDETALDIAIRLSNEEAAKFLKEKFSIEEQE